MLNTLEAQPFAEAVVCAIDTMMGCAAAEDKYRGFRHLASIICPENREKYHRLELR
jgi:hypothetical protein